MNGRKRIFAVIDTNVLVASLFSKDGTSSPAQVISAIISGRIIPLFNNEIIEEYRDVLSREKFKFNQELVENLLSLFTEFGFETGRIITSDEYFPDRDDIVFYEIAMSVNDSFLVTGNLKHFPRKPFVVTPSQMIDILNNSR